MTFSLSITDAPGTGLYAWSLSDQGFTASGLAPTISRCLTKCAAARQAIERHVTGHPYPEDAALLNLPSHPHPTHVHPPSGVPLPAQQDIPAHTHPRHPSSFIYPRLSKSG